MVAFVILLFAEHLSRKKAINQEVSRKIPHIVGGLAIASWPFFVSMNFIVGLGLAFLAASTVVRKFNLFAGSRAVDRLSWGELFFPAGVTLTAALHPSQWIFAVAILHLGVADAVAALVGKRLGKHFYKIFGHRKSIEGSIAFAVVSVIITFWFVVFAPTGLSISWTVILLLPILSSLTEAIAPWGLDNLFVPVIVVIALSWL